MQRGDAQLLTLAEVAADTGLDPAFLDWALTAGLLGGARDEAGTWTVPYDEAPPSHFSQIEAPPVDATMSAAPPPPVATSAQSDPAGASPEHRIAALLRQLADREARLAEKDRVIAELGLSLARLGEAAARSGPRDRGA